MNIFRTINEREEHKRILNDMGKINYDWLISMGEEVMDAERAYRSDVRGTYFGSKVDRDQYDKFCRNYYKGYMFGDVCAMIGVSVSAVFNAVRICNRYYERGGQKCLDSEALVRSQM